MLLVGREAHRQECLCHRLIADADDTAQEQGRDQTAGGVGR
jgi:hypothetical protein